MANILVSLVSEQTIPNVLLIKELKLIDKHLLVSTEKMERFGKSQAIISASGISPDKFFEPPAETPFKPPIITVIEDSLSDIEIKLKSLNFDDNDVFFVNLTGGTKIMSIGVYNFFRNKRSQIFYIPIGKNIYRQIFPEIKQPDVLITHNLSVNDYLTSYGIEITNAADIHGLSVDAKFTTEFFNVYLANPLPQVVQTLRSLRGKKSVAIDSVAGLRPFLQDISFPLTSSDHLTQAQIKYLTGDWFEEYIYSLIQSSSSTVATGIKIKRGKVENEFDVVFTRENGLYVIECKTNVIDSETGKNILGETLYKLAALRKDFGLYVKAYIFTLTEKGVQQSHIDRSRLMDIEIIDGTILKDVSQRELLLKSFA